MDKKYRIKLKNNRIIGPFLIADIGELYIKGRIQGDELCQTFPVGSWKTIRDFDELENLILDIAKNNITLETLRKSLKSKPDPIDPNDIPKEFEYQKKTNTKIGYKELKEKFKKKFPNLEKTRITKRPTETIIDKTAIVNQHNPLEEKKDSERPEEQPIDDKQEEQTPAEPEQEINPDKATQVYNVRQAFQVVEYEAKQFEDQIKEENQEKQKKENGDKRSAIKDKINIKKKQITPIIAITFLAILYFFAFDENPKNDTQPKRFFIKIPVVYPVANKNKASEFFRLGKASYAKGTYVEKLTAIKYFFESVRQQYRENKAIGYLILANAELYPNILEKEKKESAINLHKIIQTTISQRLKDINITMGSALFYHHIGKNKTAIHIIENYLRINQPSPKLVSIYSNILIAQGNLEKARKAFEQVKMIIEQGEKNNSPVPPDAYLSALTFYKINEQYKEVEDLIKRGLKKNPQSMALFIEYAEFKIRELERLDVSIKDPLFLEKFKHLVKTTKRIQAHNAGQSPAHYAKYLEFAGFIGAIQGDLKKATKLFRTALKINESNELRSKLATLEIGGDKAVEKLIRENKILVLMKKARKNLKEKKWKEAFLNALSAVEYNENYVPAQLLFAKIQTKRGYLEDAIETLKELNKTYKKDKMIFVDLINAYIKAKKLDTAYQKIIEMSRVPGLNQTSDFFLTQGNYFLSDGNDLLGSKWLQESIVRNPLNDQAYFQLAKIYFRNRSYNQGKNYLSKALELDPENIEYHIVYADILYELDSSEVAIGYLRKILEKNKGNPNLIGSIAIFYYRNGQSKEFEEYKKKFEELNSASTHFYSFLVRASLLNDDYDKAIEYSNQLLNADPSDIDTRMRLGFILYDQGLYQNAIDILTSVLDRFKTFPKVHYYLAKIYLNQGKAKQAIIEARKEIKGNPELHYGYYILGETYRRMSRWNEAINNLEKALSINSKSVETLTALGWINMRQNFTERARELYLKAKEQEKNNPEIRKQLGLIYQSIGQRAIALDELKTYLKLKPDASDRKDIESLIRRLD